jgi:hypothetical protein
MMVASNVISIAAFRGRGASEPRAETLVFAESAERRLQIAAILVRAELAGGGIDWVDTLDAVEARLAEASYLRHVIDLGGDAVRAAPLLDAMMALPDARTIVVCELPDLELQDLGKRFPCAAVIAPTELSVDWVRGDATPRRQALSGSSGLEALIESTAALRCSIAGIGRQMAVADSELDAGKATDGQIHLVAAMQRLAQVEDQIVAMERDLRDRLARNRTQLPKG